MTQAIGQARGLLSSNRGLHGFHILTRRKPKENMTAKALLKNRAFSCKGCLIMDKLKACAIAFEALFNIKYRCIIGRKGKTHEFTLAFKSYHFHHLAGLHKLSDKQEVRGNRERVFKNILSGDISYKNISKSKDFNVIMGRLNYLHGLEQFMDSNSLIFKYDSRKNASSHIKAKYLLENELYGDTVYLFLDEDNYMDALCGVSIFPKESVDYTIGQTGFTLLYKEKINTVTGETIIQYDRITSHNKR